MKTYLRTLRAFHTNLIRERAGAADIANYRPPAPVPSAAATLLPVPRDTPPPAVPTGGTPSARLLAAAERAYAAHAALHPDLADEYETRVELDEAERALARAERERDALDARRHRVDALELVAPPPPDDSHLAGLDAAAARAATALAAAEAELTAPGLDPRSHAARVLPARVERLARRERDARRQARQARDRHAAALSRWQAATAFDAMRATLGGERAELDGRMRAMREDIATLTALLPDTERAPLRERRTAAGMRRATTTRRGTPASHAYAWAQRIKPSDLQRLDYSPKNGQLLGLDSLPLDPAADTVRLRDRHTGAAMNVPKDVIVSVLGCGTAYRLDTTLPADNPRRWRWDTLTVRQPAGAPQSLTVPATSLNLA